MIVKTKTSIPDSIDISTGKNMISEVDYDDNIGEYISPLFNGGYCIRLVARYIKQMNINNILYDVAFDRITRRAFSAYEINGKLYSRFYRFHEEKDFNDFKLGKLDPKYTIGLP